jgi:Pectate lyase superfamily protein
MPTMSDVHHFGAKGDGRTDDTAAIQHALATGDGVLEFPRGDYRVTKTLTVDLAKQGRIAIHGSGGTAKIVMNGPGPAIFLKGSHKKSADPLGFAPQVWRKERMPTVAGIEIEGRHKDADGIRIAGVMQPTLTGVLIRQVHTAVHITERCRNVLIDGCHFYFNTGVGVHLDGVNLHQTIIADSHISYCRLGGIRIEKSEIRNLQITGNDIEYNNNRTHVRQAFQPDRSGRDASTAQGKSGQAGKPDLRAEPAAEIYIDVGEGSVREGTIASNTIQATYSPNGANIRFVGRDVGQAFQPDARGRNTSAAQEKSGQAGKPDLRNHKVGMWTITGNLIGSQHVNVHLTSARGVVLSGNYIYSGHHRNLLVENSRNIVVGSNCFGHNPDYRKNELCTGVRFVDSTEINLHGTLIEDCHAGQHTVPGVVPIKRDGLLELVRCRRVNVTGCQVFDGAPNGVYLEDCADTLLTGCTVLDRREKKLMQSAILWKESAKQTGNLIASCRVGTGTQQAIVAPKSVMQSGNVVG